MFKMKIKLLDGYEFVGLVGKVALAFVATIEAALAKAADAFLKSLALIVARQHHPFQ